MPRATLTGCPGTDKFQPFNHERGRGSGFSKEPRPVGRRWVAEMVLIAPDIVQECRNLSIVVLAFGLLVGLLLWLLGGWGHRFCIVLVTTLVAGVGGLYYGPPLGMQPLVAGLFLGVAAGALALALARVLVFIGVGFLALFLAHFLAPSWDEPVACFVAGGLLGVLLFQFWVMALASLGGTLLMAYTTLGLAARLSKGDVVGWVEKNGPVLNWAGGSVVVLGILLQLLVLRRKAKPPPPKVVGPPAPVKPFWQRLLPQAWVKKAA